MIKGRFYSFFSQRGFGTFGGNLSLTTVSRVTSERFLNRFLSMSLDCCRYVNNKTLNMLCGHGKFLLSAWDLYPRVAVAAGGKPFSCDGYLDPKRKVSHQRLQCLSSVIIGVSIAQNC